MITTDSPLLMDVYRGWDGYQTSLARAIAALTREQLAYRLEPNMRSVGEIAGHIAFGRIDWFSRMGAPGSAEIVEQAVPWWKPGEQMNSDMASSATDIVRWLEASWQMMKPISCSGRWPISARLIVTRTGAKLTRFHASGRYGASWLTTFITVGNCPFFSAHRALICPELGDNGGHIIEIPLADPLDCVFITRCARRFATGIAGHWRGWQASVSGSKGKANLTQF